MNDPSWLDSGYPSLVARCFAVRDSPPEALLVRAREVTTPDTAAADRLSRETLAHLRRLLEGPWANDPDDRSDIAAWDTALPDRSFYRLAVAFEQSDSFDPATRETIEQYIARAPWLPGFVVYLRQLGPEGKRRAETIDGDPNAAVDLRGVRGDLPVWLRLLVRVVWEDRVQPEIEHEAEIKRREAGKIGVLALARRDTQGVAALRAHRIERGALVADGDQVLVPYVSIDLLEGDTLKQLGSSFAPRLLEWQAATWHRKWLDGDNDANVRIPGGWAGFAARLGLSSEARKQLETLCQALAGVTWAWDTAGSSGRYPLLGGFELRKSAGRRSKGEQGALLTITLSELFRPPTARGIHDQRLVPIVPLPDARRCGVAPRFYGLVDSLHRRGVLALSDGADHLRRFGGVSVDWRGIADERFRPHVPAVLASDGWCERWAMNGDRWTLRRSAETERAIDHLLSFVPKGRKGRKG